MIDKSRVLADVGRAWDPSHFAQAAPWLPWRAPAGSVLTPKAPPGTAEALEKAEGGLQKRLGQEPALAGGTAGHGPAGSCPETSRALLPGHVVSARSSFVVLRNSFLKRQAVWERRGHPAALPASSWAPSAPASCRDAGHRPVWFPPPESISQVTLVSHKQSRQEGP